MRTSYTNRRRVLKKKRATTSTGEQAQSSAAASGSRKRFATKRTAAAGRGAPSAGALAVRQASALRKKHAQERMVLKEHMAELKRKRRVRSRGDDAATERRQMGKYMRQLRGQQIAKHASELQGVASASAALAPSGGNGADVPDWLTGPAVATPHAALRREQYAPAQVHPRKAQRYLTPPVTVGLPHGRSSDVSCMATPVPGNVRRNVALMVAHGSASAAAPARGAGGVRSSMLARAHWGDGAGGGGDEWLDDDDDTAANGSGGRDAAPARARQDVAPHELRQLFTGFGV